MWERWDICIEEGWMSGLPQMIDTDDPVRDHGIEGGGVFCLRRRLMQSQLSRE